MNRSPERIVYNWLRELKIPVSFNCLEEKMRSHPEYPSLLSITDILDDLQIENAAMVVNKGQIYKLPVPFLAYSYKNNSEFSVIYDIRKSFDTLSKEFKNWSGVIVAAEKPIAVWQNKENNSWLRKEKRSKIIFGSTVFVFLLSFLILFAVNFWWLSAALLLTSLAGLLVSILIILQEFGYSNRVTDKLCSTGENTDCNAVIKSKSAHLAFGFGWADAGIVYFSSLVLALILSILTGRQSAVDLLLCIVAIFSLPFTIYSLYYQKQVVHKWCMLCLITLSILWLQFALLSSLLFSESFSLFSLNSSLLVLFSFFCTASIWFLLKPVLAGRKDLQDRNFELIRFRNDPEVFETLLEHQRQVDITPFRDDLQFGNAQAPVQIVVVCNPYCSPCAQAHEYLYDLADIYDFGLTIRFAIDADNQEDSKTKAVEYLLKCIFASHSNTTGHKQQIIHDWFSTMNFEEFSLIHTPSGEIEVGDMMKQHDLWSKAAEIEFTPTIFINGFQIPKQFRINDLWIIIDKWRSRDKIVSESLKL